MEQWWFGLSLQPQDLGIFWLTMSQSNNYRYSRFQLMLLSTHVHRVSFFHSSLFTTMVKPEQLSKDIRDKIVELHKVAMGYKAVSKNLGKKMTIVGGNYLEMEMKHNSPSDWKSMQDLASWLEDDHRERRWTSIKLHGRSSLMIWVSWDHSHQEYHE